jgi:MFS family permease
VRRALERLSTLADVFRNPQLRRLELSWAGFYVGEWTQFAALSVYAFQVGGAAAVGGLGLARMVPAAVALPFGGMLADRYPRQRVLLGIYVVRALGLVAMAAALGAESSRAVVFALAGLVAVAGAPVRPATLSLVPMLTRTPKELVATNVSSSTLEGLGTLAGPALGGVLAATAGFEVAVAVAAAVNAVCALLVARIRREGEVAGARRRVERSLSHELLGGVRTLAHEPGPRLIVLLFNSQTMVRGLLNVLLVVASIELLGMGESGFGWLNAALGAGALVGGLGAVGLVARRRLAGIFGIALVLWGLPIALVGAWPRAGWALVCLGVVGIGNALLDISGFTLLQRTVDEHVLGRVFGVFEIGCAVGVAVGSLFGSLLVEKLGIRSALVVAGAILPVLALASLHGLRRIDASVEVPERELELVSDVPLFSPLAPTTLERLAARLERLDVAAGTTVVEKGTAGDRFYLIAYGEVDVVLNGVTMNTLSTGDYFGEIALLHDIPRTADCMARTDSEIYSLGRDVFVAAVSGDVRSSAEAESVMGRRLEELSGVGDGSPTEQRGEAEQRDS